MNIARMTLGHLARGGDHGRRGRMASVLSRYCAPSRLLRISCRDAQTSIACASEVHDRFGIVRTFARLGWSGDSGTQNPYYAGVRQ